METQNLPANIAEEKIAAWKSMGQLVIETNAQLVLLKEEALKKVIELPKDINKIVEYENVLKQVKQDKKIIQEKRMVVTKKFDAVAEGLMKSEKEFDPTIKLYEEALITVKKQKSVLDNANNAKIEETKRIREQCLNSITQQYAMFETKIVETISKYYEQCLNKNVLPQTIIEKMPTMQSYLSEANFNIAQPILSRVYLAQEEVNLIWQEAKKMKYISPASFVSKYVADLKNKFEFYYIALKNKEQSLALAKQEASKQLNDIANKADDDAVAAKLEAISTNVADVVVDSGKALKSVFKLNMEETEQSAIQIISAFSANWHAAKEQLGLKKWFNLSVKQMADSLVTLKNKDNRFEVSGIIFTQVDKL